MNIDIFPGFLFLLMLFLANFFMEKPNLQCWFLLVGIGAIAALLKQTFGIFWLAILISYSLILLTKKNKSRQDRQVLGFFIAGSVTSFICYWIFMCFVFRNSLIEGSFFTTPLKQLISFSQEYKPNAQVNYPLWLYLRNMPFYGFLVTFLIIPGLIMNFRSKSSLQRTVAISWIVAFFFLHLIIRREVRYFAFLSPLSAFLVIPPLTFFLKKPKYLYLVLGILCIDIIVAGKEAIRIANPFYQKSQLKQYLEPITTDKSGKTCTINEYLCFMPPWPSPFCGDHYHRKFHFSPYHIKFYTSPKIEFSWQPYRAQKLHQALTFKPESYLVYGNMFPMSNKDDLDKFNLIIAKCEKIPFDWKNILLKSSQKGIIFSSIQLNAKIEREGFIFLVIKNQYGNTFPLIQTGKFNFQITKPAGGKEKIPRKNLQIWGYKILNFVYVENCGTKIKKIK